MRLTRLTFPSEEPVHFFWQAEDKKIMRVLVLGNIKTVQKQVKV